MKHNGNRGNPSSYKIFSFYNSKVNPKIPKYQKAVFTKFGYPITHIVDEKLSHGDFINQIFRTVTDVDYLIFFDVDCIPVKKEWVAKLLEDLAEPRTIVGAAQTANHLREGKNLYVSPFFFAISTAYIQKLGYPDMNMTEDMDTGQNLTGEVLKNGGIVKYWWPTHIEQEEWSLYHPDHSKFGPGTTYNDLIYHAFLSRFDISDRFKNKCKSILYGVFFKIWKALGSK